MAIMQEETTKDKKKAVTHVL